LINAYLEQADDIAALVIAKTFYEEDLSQLSKIQEAAAIAGDSLTVLQLRAFYCVEKMASTVGPKLGERSWHGLTELLEKLAAVEEDLLAQSMEAKLCRFGSGTGPGPSEAAYPQQNLKKVKLLKDSCVVLRRSLANRKADPLPKIGKNFAEFVATNELSSAFLVSIEVLRNFIEQANKLVEITETQANRICPDKS